MDIGDVRWRPPPLLLIPLLMSGGFLIYIDVFQSQIYNAEPITLPEPKILGFRDDVNLKGFLVKTPGCKIPEMEANDPNIQEYVFEEKPVECNNGTPPLVSSNLTSLFVLQNFLISYDVNDTTAFKCCYSSFWRGNSTKYKEYEKVKFNGKCVEFNDSVNVNDEYVIVKCFYNETLIYKDFFAFVPFRANNKILDNQPLNVLMIGLDSISRLNFYRQMPKTLSILRELKAVELLGYNKVGDNTFPNLIPVLTGLSEDELVNTCWPNTKAQFDKCPFIWNDFNSKGFSTVFAEDASWMGLFNYQRRGFEKQPTDYYWDTFNSVAENSIGNEHRLNVYQCIGSREVYKILIDYIDIFSKTMYNNNKHYFGFYWSSSLSHDLLNKPKLGDENYQNLLLELNSSGVLNKTVLIFMSDHGIRWGGIRSTFQGRIEERLPFMFIYLPEWYRNNYSTAYSNLVRNSRRLTTPYDLHETLKDLTHSYDLTRDFLTSRTKNTTEKRAYSLFDSISPYRTCTNAYISSHWCTCQTSVQMDKNDSRAIEASAFIVDYINNKLVGFSECATLELEEVMDARLQIYTQQEVEGNEDFTLTLRTKPGGALFEGTVRKRLVKKKYTFDITGTISRLNLYGKQSSCITDFHLKLYCYCKYMLDN